jgi:hypothetical protein
VNLITCSSPFSSARPTAAATTGPARRATAGWRVRGQTSPPNRRPARTVPMPRARTVRPTGRAGSGFGWVVMIHPAFVALDPGGHPVTKTQRAQRLSGHRAVVGEVVLAALIAEPVETLVRLGHRVGIDIAGHDTTPRPQQPVKVKHKRRLTGSGRPRRSHTASRTARRPAMRRRPARRRRRRRR